MPEIPKNGPVHVIGYARVSGLKQQTEGHSLEAQKKEIRKYCNEHGWILLGIVTEVFSGHYLTERKHLMKLREQYVKGKQAHVVLVWKLDRLSRDQNHMQLLAYEMTQHGVRLESCTEAFDDSPTGILIRQVYAFSSSLERTKIIERAKIGQHNRSDKGLLFGGGVPNYGWTFDKDGDFKNARYIVDPITGPVVVEMYTWYAKEYLSYRLIAKRLNERGTPGPRGGTWAASMVARVICEPKYKGDAYNRRVQWRYDENGKKKPHQHPSPTPIAEGVIPAIASVELWKEASARRAVAKEEAKRHNKAPHQALLRTGYVKCGATMHVQNIWHYDSNSSSTTYKCNRKKHHFNSDCTHKPTMGAVGLDELAWKFVGENLEKYGRFKDVLLFDLQGTADIITTYDELIRKAEEQQQVFIDAMSRAKEEIAQNLFLEKIEGLSKSIAEHREKRDALIPATKQSEQIKQEVDEFLQWCADMKGRYQEATYEEKRIALKRLGFEAEVWKNGDPDHERYTMTLRPEIMQ